MACRRRENGRAEKGRHCRAHANAAPTPRRSTNRRLRPPQAAVPARWPVPPPPSAARRSVPRRLRTSACASRQAASHAPAAAVHAARIRLGELAEVRNIAVLGWREYWGHLGGVTVEIECLKLYHFSYYITHGSSKKNTTHGILTFQILVTFDHFIYFKIFVTSRFLKYIFPFCPYKNIKGMFWKH